VKYFNLIGDSLGKKIDLLDLEDESTVQDLIEYLSKKYGEKFNYLVLDESGNIHPHIRLFINNQVTNPQVKQKLNEGDTVSFFIAIIGG